MGAHCRVGYGHLVFLQNQGEYVTLSPNWRTTYKRYSVIALAASTFLQVVWGVVQNPPMWAVLVVNGLIGGLGLIGSYLAQPEVIGGTDASATE
jgi:hypothetical protein